MEIADNESPYRSIMPLAQQCGSCGALHVVVAMQVSCANCTEDVLNKVLRGLRSKAGEQTLSKFVHASFILINLLPDGLVNIPPILHTAQELISSRTRR